MSSIERTLSLGVFEFEDGIEVRCVGLWLRKGYLIVSDLKDENKEVTVDGECKFLDWEFGIV